MKFWIIWLSLACSVVSIFFVYINVCCFCCFQYFGTVSTAYMYFPTINLDKASDKIKVKETETSKFWSHFKSFIGPHPAIDEHERDPSQPWHQPVGVSGDDARYTLAGRKIIIMMISSVLQQIESVLSFYVSWGYNIYKWFNCLHFIDEIFCWILIPTYFHYRCIHNQVLTYADSRFLSYGMKSAWAPEAWIQFWELLRGA